MLGSSGCASIKVSGVSIKPGQKLNVICEVFLASRTKLHRYYSLSVLDGGERIPPDTGLIPLSQIVEETGLSSDSERFEVVAGHRSSSARSSSSEVKLSIWLDITISSFPTK